MKSKITYKGNLLKIKLIDRYIIVTDEYNPNSAIDLNSSLRDVLSDELLKGFTDENIKLIITLETI